MTKLNENDKELLKEIMEDSIAATLNTNINQNFTLEKRQRKLRLINSLAEKFELVLDQEPYIDVTEIEKVLSQEPHLSEIEKGVPAELTDDQLMTAFRALLPNYIAALSKYTELLVKSNKIMEQNL